MLQALNRALGFIGGMFLYPMKSFIVSLAVISLTLLAAAAALIGLPIFFALVAAELSEGNKIWDGLVAGLLVAAILLILVPIVTALVVSSEIYNGFKDLFRAAMFGAIDGFTEGLFFHVLHRAVFDVAVFSSSLQNIILTVAQTVARYQQNQGLDEQGMAGLMAQDDDDIDYFNLEDVQVELRTHGSTHAQVTSSLSEYSTMTTERRAAFQPLSRDELQLAKGISDLDTIVGAYESLHERLTEFNAETLDELIMMPITQPALLVKQYQETNGQWKVIPGRTVIIDKPSQERWISQNNSHPVTREPLDNTNPEKINGTERKTRYKIRDYKDINDAQELFEASRTIRYKLDQANPSNLQVDKVVAGFRAAVGERFFGEGESMSQENSQEEAHLSRP